MGSWKLEDTLVFVANTHNASTGAAADADGDAVAYRIFENEVTTPLLTGTMTQLDGTNTIGFYSEQITLAAASGFEKGRSYHIYISAAVASVTGTMAHSFQIEAEVDANTVSGTAPANVTQFGGVAGTFTGGRPEVNASHVSGSSTAADTLEANIANLDAAVSTRATPAQVNTEADSALADYDAPTYTELLNLMRLALRKDAALATDLATLLQTVNTNLGSGAGAYTNTTDAQEALKDTLGAPAGASLSLDVAAVKTETAAILIDTNEVQTDWTNGGRLDTILDARASQTSVDTRASQTSVDTIDDYLDSEITAIKAKTDQLTFTVANQVDAGVLDKTGFALSTSGVNAVRDAISDDIIETEGSITLQAALSIILAVCAGETDTGGAVFRTPNGNTVRVTATVNASNERTGITLNPSS